MAFVEAFKVGYKEKGSGCRVCMCQPPSLYRLDRMSKKWKGNRHIYLQASKP